MRVGRRGRSRDTYRDRGTGRDGRKSVGQRERNWTGGKNKCKDTADVWVEVHAPSCGVVIGVKMNVIETGVGEEL